MNITENIKNIIDTQDDALDKKNEYVDEVWELLNKAYEPIGGLQGRGFDSKEDMIKNIPFWKVSIKDGKIKAIMLYRDKNGRKRVVIATDGTPSGKRALINMQEKDSERAYSEVSGPSLRFMIRAFGIEYVLRWAIDIEKVPKILGQDIEPVENTEYPEDLKPYLYKRQLGGGMHTVKIMIGTPHKPIR